MSMKRGPRAYGKKHERKYVGRIAGKSDRVELRAFARWFAREYGDTIEKLGDE